MSFLAIAVSTVIALVSLWVFRRHIEYAIKGVAKAMFGRRPTDSSDDPHEKEAAERRAAAVRGAFWTTVLTVFPVLPFVLAGLVFRHVHSIAATWSAPWGTVLDVVAAGALLVALGGLFNKSLPLLPADPPTVALLTVLGYPMKHKLEPGRKLLVGFPWLFGMIPIDITEFDADFLPDKIVVTDGANVFAEVMMSWHPGHDAPDPGSMLWDFVTRGKDNWKVRALFDNTVTARIRPWAMSHKEGPKTWREAVGASPDAVAALVKSLFGEDLPRIPCHIPTPILLKYYADPQVPPTPSEEKEWLEDWGRVSTELNDPKRYSPTQIETIKKKIEERRKAIRDVMNGNGGLLRRDLGVMVTRCSVAISPSDRVAQATDLAVKEQLQRDAEMVETEAVAAMMTKYRTDHPELSAAEVKDLVQTERKKVTKTIEEKKYGLTTESLGPAAAVLNKYLESKRG